MPAADDTARGIRARTAQAAPVDAIPHTPGTHVTKRVVHYVCKVAPAEEVGT